MNFKPESFDKSPLELFDAGDWPACLHATMQVFNVAANPAATQEAIEDTGLLHELAHLAAGLDICTHHDLAELRALLEQTTACNLRL